MRRILHAYPLCAATALATSAVACITATGTTTNPAPDGGQPEAGASPPDAGAFPANDARPEAGNDAGPSTSNDASDATYNQSDGSLGTVRANPTNGSAVAIAPDGKAAVAVNRTANSVSVFATDFTASPATATRTIEIPTGDGTEPYAVVLGNDGDTAYVTYRRAQRVAKVVGLHSTTPSMAQATATTGSEPTGIAISPSGLRLYVANWAEGTVTVVNTSDMSLAATVDLNASLAATGFLGSVAGRPALAHPRAVVVTDGGTGNDSAETVYVTEFFSQARTSGLPTDDSQFDEGRQGVVYRFNAGSYAVGAPITIAPVHDTSFPDSDGNATGCFPNQLAAAAIDSGRLYVTAVCASPRGPVNVIGPAADGGAANPANAKTQVHASLFVVDTAANAELPAQRLVLTQQFQALFTSLGGSVTPRFPLIPTDVAFVPGAHVAYVTALGSDAIYRIKYNADGSLNQVGSSTQPFIDLAVAGANLGQLPYGLAIDGTGASSLVVNETTRNVSIVEFATQAVAGAVASSTPPAAGTPAAAVNNGHRLFATGLGRWSLNGAAWNSCEACHAEGLTDNVTWFFGRGPRQTISLDGTFDSAGDQRLLNWTAINDEIHDFELNTRGNSGGVGAIVHATSTPPALADRIIFDNTAVGAGQVGTASRQDGLNGSTAAMMPSGPGVVGADGGTVNSTLSNWDDIQAYVKQIRAPRGAVGVAAADVAAGQALFEQNNCAGCHGGPAWTISKRFYTPGAANNDDVTGALITQSWTRPAGFPAALLPAASTFRLSPFNAANDQITCVLRNVGTFPASPPTGIAPAGVVVKEVRAGGGVGNPPVPSMTATAQGATGFNVPALVGMVTGAPYFHAGNARTLEELLGTTFQAHHEAFSSNFSPTPTQITQLVAFLTSIDDATAPIAVPSTSVLGFNADICATGSFQ
jgi:DNA-binding beta-propeller fold protein YncE